MKRPDQWQSRLGFILATVGSAVGLGNIWRFPAAAVRNGGGAFIIVYLAMVIGIGVPMLMSELVLGRAGQRSVVGTFSSLRPGSRWWLTGWVSMAAAFIILSFYMVIAGWTLLYLIAGPAGVLDTTSAGELAATFERLSANPWLALFGAGWFALVTIAVVVSGITEGIERYNRVLMPGVVILLTILVARTLFLPGAREGLAWLFRPDIARFGIRGGLEALGQAFFSLSLGMGAMLTYGSYLGRTENIPSSAVMIAAADVGVALLAGMIVIPALFAFGIEPVAGPGLLFVALPAVFSSMPFGAAWNALFFLLLAFAALSSAVSMLEVVVAWLVDRYRIDRRTAAIGSGALSFVLGIPSALAAGVWSGFQVGGRDFLGLMDFLASNLLLPLGGLLTALFVAWVWGTDRAVAELRLGAPDARLLGAWSRMVRYVVPAAIAVVLAAGLVT